VTTDSKPLTTAEVGMIAAKKLHEMGYELAPLGTLERVQRENDLLRQAFKEYGFHHVDCLYETDAYPCDCGYHDVVAQLVRAAVESPAPCSTPASPEV
jgi:hypothetical protein